MAGDPNDPNPALRAQLLAAEAEITPQLRGLHNLASLQLSPNLLAQVQAEIASRNRRKDLIMAVLTSLDNVIAALVLLENDGYPALTNEIISADIFAELQADLADNAAAAAIFTASAAVSVGLDVPAATLETQPIPA